MEGHLREGVVRVEGDARQRYYDARGYGRPADGDAVDLSRVEAAHLLFRGDLAAVDGRGFRAFFVASARERDRFGLRFLVYADLRERGFYLSPAREGWPGTEGGPEYDFAVYRRGAGPPDGAVAYRISVVGEREPVALAGLGAAVTDAGAAADADAGDAPTVVLSVVDEESELTYLAAGHRPYDGRTGYTPPEDLTGVLLSDRVLCWDPPASLYERGFYGQPLTGRDGTPGDALQLSLVEAAALAAEGHLSVGAESDDARADDAGADEAAGEVTIVERGRAVEGDRFDRRLRAYTELRGRGVVPKTGFKFGADFRTYAHVESVAELGHSETLVRVVDPGYAPTPRDLALDVRLAGGVRKELAFALVPDSGDVEWLSLGRLTP